MRLITFSLKAQSKIAADNTIIFFNFIFWRNKAWCFIWIFCVAEDSHEILSLIFRENIAKMFKTLICCSHDWHLLRCFSWIYTICPFVLEFSYNSSISFHWLGNAYFWLYLWRVYFLKRYNGVIILCSLVSNKAHLYKRLARDDQMSHNRYIWYTCATLWSTVPVLSRFLDFLISWFFHFAPSVWQSWVQTFTDINIASKRCIDIPLTSFRGSIPIWKLCFMICDDRKHLPGICNLIILRNNS